MTYISIELSRKEKKDLEKHLNKIHHVFAWQVDQMLGIDLRDACYKIQIDPKFKPVWQRTQKMAPDRRDKVNKKVDHLLQVGFLKPIEYPKWVSNIVNVPRKDGHIRCALTLLI